MEEVGDADTCCQTQNFSRNDAPSPRLMLLTSPRKFEKNREGATLVLSKTSSNEGGVTPVPPQFQAGKETPAALITPGRETYVCWGRVLLPTYFSTKLSAPGNET